MVLYVYSVSQIRTKLTVVDTILLVVLYVYSVSQIRTKLTVVDTILLVVLYVQLGSKVPVNSKMLNMSQHKNRILKMNAICVWKLTN